MSGILIGQSAINVLLLAGVLTIAALGFSIVWGVMNIINLVHGAAIMLGAYVTFIAFTFAGIDPFLTIPISMVLLFGLGYLIQRNIINYVMRAPMLTTFLLTFGLEIIIINLAQFFFKSDLRAITTGYSGSSLTLYADPAANSSIEVPYIKLGALIVALLLTLLTHLLMSRTRLGRAIRSTGMDKDAAQLTGARISTIYALTFAISAGLAGAAGSLIAMTQSFQPGFGGTYTLYAFVIVVLGGLGSVPAVFLGALAFSLITVLTGLWQPGLTQAAAFALLVIMLVVRPSGIAGKAFYQ
ncbi:High-affinity branched-chain amino acid transport system permease protein LivH [Thermoflexales bacterium]|nr:High-affinity branched-chain amino acid transport system permease protein LivH [Thermoflexales bacterium]